MILISSESISLNQSLSLPSGAGSVDSRLRHAPGRVVGRLLQSPVLPDGHHADHGPQERVAPGQDVPVCGGDQEEPGGHDHPAPRRGLCPWPVHGG